MATPTPVNLSEEEMVEEEEIPEKPFIIQEVIDPEPLYDTNFNIDEEEDQSAICIEHDMLSAKAYLQKPSPGEGLSLFDHLSELLNKILAERPQNILDFFEEYSRKMKEDRFRPATDHLQDIFIPPLQYENAKKFVPLLKISHGKELAAEEMEEDVETETKNKKPDIMKSLYYFEQAGIDLPHDEMFLVEMSLQKFADSQPIDKLRFWGKIFGLQKNYFVAEVELKEEEITRRLQLAEDAQKEGEPLEEGEAQPKEVAEKESEGKAESEVEAEAEELEIRDFMKRPPKFPPIPQSAYKRPPEIPMEKLGSGLNKKTYYVCNFPGEEWICLPEVTPKQIQVSRQVKRYFTGNLNAEVITYPEFPGNEMNYLRSQIARISAGTQVSPLGYYHFGEGEEEAMEEVLDELKTDFVENPDYEPVPVKDLIDPSLSFWVHHSLHILKQGRSKWWNPVEKEGPEDVGDEEMDVEGEEDLGDKGGEQPEIGPTLLTPLSEDITLETTPPWNAYTTSILDSYHAIAFIRSNLWPGAVAYASGKSFDNVYVGWGHKFLSYNLNPPVLPAILIEYEHGPDIMEVSDPTPEEEEAWRLAHEKKVPEVKVYAGERGEGGEGAEPEVEEEEEEEDEEEEEEEEEEE